MGKKYIIEKDDNESIWSIYADANGDATIEGVSLTPYAEPDLEQVRKEAYEDGYKTTKVQCDIQTEKDLREVGERHYQKGLSDAWDAARKIIRMPEGDLLNLFTECYAAVCTSVQVFLKYDASECIEKIRAYEQRQEEINVGDEVVAEYGNAIVVGVTENCVRCMYSNGKHATLRKLDAVRTGRHFPEIAEVLQKMKES